MPFPDDDVTFENVTVLGVYRSAPAPEHRVEIGTGAELSEVSFYNDDPLALPGGVFVDPADDLVVRGLVTDGINFALIRLTDGGAIHIDSTSAVRFLGSAQLRAVAGGPDAFSGYSFDADTDTGIWRSAANRMDFVAGGTLRLVVANNAVTMALPGNAAAGIPLHAYGFGEVRLFTCARAGKTRIRPLRSALDLIERLRPVRFHARRGHGDPKPERIGLIAEEVADADPRLVTLDGDGNPGNIDVNAVVAALIGSVQALSARVAALEAQP